MLIKAITIENFKGISEPVRVEFKPLTLLFGPNSSGKSTIIQALHYKSMHAFTADSDTLSRLVQNFTDVFIDSEDEEVPSGDTSRLNQEQERLMPVNIGLGIRAPPSHVTSLMNS